MVLKSYCHPGYFAGRSNFKPSEDQTWPKWTMDPHQSRSQSEFVALPMALPLLWDTRDRSAVSLAVRHFAR